MRMTTIRRTALLGLLVLGVGVLAGCTKHGDEARERQIEAQVQLAERAGVKVEKAADGTTSTNAPAPSKSGGVADGPAALGQRIATANGCVACHTIDGKASVGPTWKGLSERNTELVSGGPVKADDAYLKESITNPNAKVVKGFAPNLMPATFGNSLKPEEIDQFVAYIKTLK